MKKQKRIPYESCIIIYFFLQLIYVYANGTCVSVSDEYTYKQIAMDIFQGEAVSSFHYPFVYPFILSLSFYFGDVFYNVMLFENILLKTILLAVIFKMLASVVENREDRGLACITSRSGESCISEVGLYICNRNLYFDSSVTSIWEENYSDMLVAFCRS